MRMKLFAGALALAAIGFLSQGASDARAAEPAKTATGQQSKINVARIKSALKLTKEQKRHWAPVEAALIKISRRQARVESAGVVKRIKRSAVGVVFDATAVAQLVAAARPLVDVLDDEQKQIALRLAREMGLGWVLAKL